MRNWPTTIGEFFTQEDFDGRARVAVLGADVHAELFGPDDYPIDQTVRINNLPFRVIGVMEERGGGPGGNQDDAVFLPLTTAQDRIFKRKTVSGDYEVNVIYASVRDNEDIRRVQA